MTASYPANIASFPTRQDDEVIDNSHMNSVQEEIVAIELTLGTGLLSKATGSYNAITSTFNSLSSRLDNIERGVASSDVAIHPQYLAKVGGTIYPTSGDVVSLTVRQSPNATGNILAVVGSDGTTPKLTVDTDGAVHTYGALTVDSGIDISTNSGSARNLRLLSGSTYSGLVLESKRGNNTTASLTATGTMTLAGDLAIGGTITAGSLSGFVHSHENNASGGRVIPAGCLMPWVGGAVAPDGWIFCNGQTVMRTSYPDLFTAIGTAFGDGDGSTTFQVPNLAGRVPVGLDGSQTEFDAVGKTGGSKTSVAAHTHANPHSHTGITGPMNQNASHAHEYFDSQSATSDGSGSFGTAVVKNSARKTLSENTDHVHSFSTNTVSGDTASTGLNSGNLPPYLTVRYLIKT